MASWALGTDAGYVHGVGGEDGLDCGERLSLRSLHSLSVGFHAASLRD